MAISQVEMAKFTRVETKRGGANCLVSVSVETQCGVGESSRVSAADLQQTVAIAS